MYLCVIWLTVTVTGTNHTCHTGWFCQMGGGYIYVYK